jgi:hypothetical protein
MKHLSTIWQRNRRSARLTWGTLGRESMRQLKSLTAKYCLSVAAGDVQLLNDRWYVTHSGLIGIAQRRRCAGIKTGVVKGLTDPTVHRWVFRATVYKVPNSAGFVGYGDADPSNVSPLVRGAEIRVAETRAVNRALRKAYGIGLCSVEELGWLSGPAKPSPAASQPNGSHAPNGSHNGQPRLRDQLCLLIRQYNLDPTLVKAYAADFCGTAELRQASRDLVESFISRLAAAAREDRNALVCKLNSYAHPAEVNK